jgi:membrane associated rhomboid family serine protease/TPR repeat protein
MESNKTAWVTPLLITINVAVFGLMVTQGYGVFSPDTQMATAWGGLDGPLTLNGEWWRIFTYMFLHYGVLHLVLNMNVLWIFGPLTERLFGSTKFLLLYLLSGTIAAIVSIWYSPLKVALGASGAIFGLSGAITAIALTPKLRPPAQMAKSLINAGIFFVVVNGVIGLSLPMVDNAAHFGGVIGGAMIGLILASPARSSSKNDLNSALALRLSAATLLIIGSSYFLLLNNAGIQKELQTHKSETFFKQAREAFKAEKFDETLMFARSASDLGHVYAPNFVGYLYGKGLGVDVDSTQASVWFKLGAERGDPQAMLNLYKYDLSAKPAGVSTIDMNNLLLMSAKKEYFPALSSLELTLLFATGKCDDQDIAELRNAIFQGAEENNPAMVALKGWMLYHGKCAPIDHELGMKLLHKSYELGAGRAGDMLGRIYLTASGDQVANLEVARKFFETGAQKGDPRAQYELGIAFRDGLGVSKDSAKAATWLKRSAAQDHDLARSALKQLEKD